MGKTLLRSTPSVASFALALSLLPLVALDMSPVWAEQQIPDITASAFLADPPQIIRENPKGGARLAVEVRDLALSDPATLKPILGLVPEANKDQKAAIAAGLAWAARVEARLHPGYASEIEQAVTQTKDENLILGYAAGTGRYVGAPAGGKNGFGGYVAPPGANGVSVGLGGPAASSSSNVTSGFVPGNIFAPTTGVPLTTNLTPGVVPVTPNIAVPGIAESSIVVPSVAVPSVEAPTVQLPAVQLPGFQLPSVTLPAAEVPSAEVTAVPSVEVPSVEVLSTELPSVELPSAEVTSIAAPSVEVPSVAVRSLPLPNVLTPSVAPSTYPTPISQSVSPN
jgi:hypothetical protein